MRRRKMQRLIMPEISLTPLIDTALTLLIIFMVTVPIVQNNIEVNLPKGTTREASEEQKFVITMSNDGKIYFNDHLMSLDQLVDSVRGKINEQQKIPVYLRADQELSYGKVIETIDKLKQAGVRYVAISTRLMD